MRQAYESDRLDAPPSSQPGVFTDLTSRLYSLLTERVLTSESLRQQLDALQSQHEADIDRCVGIIYEVEKLKTMHREGNAATPATSPTSRSTTRRNGTSAASKKEKQVATEQPKS